MGGIVKRVAAVAAAMVVMGGVFVGGVAVGRATDDEPTEGISEAEHDRLLDTCVSERDAPAECEAWINDVVRRAEARGITYDDLVDGLAEEYRENP